eukprot:TRINITY_DN6892_c0_g2_i1.p2 TRINITY_DN6892_c0_g2~~TRINITY_DN6892_c0_g2_i1.p2  ORF type:complete len:116 (-),score=28.02 TRINITY_DN6892_c0_g2_i1:20-367(-)
MIPVQTVCAANPDVLYSKLKELIYTSFSPGKTFCIRYKKRNNTALAEKDQVVKDVGGMIPSSHKANLKNPDLTILIEVIKTVACVSIIPDLAKWKHFNISAHQTPKTPLPAKDSL